MAKNKSVFKLVLNVTIIGILNFLFISSASALQLIVQEIVEKPNSDLKTIRQERTFPIFEYINNNWISLQSKVSSEVLVESRMDAKEKEKVAVFSDISEWAQKNPIDVKKLKLLKEITYEGWEGKKQAKIFSSGSNGSGNLENKKPLETWKKETPSTQVLNKIYPEFKKLFPPGTGSYSVNWKNSDLELRDAFLSSEGKWLISLKIKDEKLKEIKNFDGLLGDNIPFFDQFFAIVNGELKYLGENFHPILADDFADNGQTTWLMIYTGYNREAYVLWDPDFTKKVSFKYLFH